MANPIDYSGVNYNSNPPQYEILNSMERAEVSPKEPEVAWHFCRRSDLDGLIRLRYSDEIVETGKTYRATGPLILCSNGMHASYSPLDALAYYHYYCATGDSAAAADTDVIACRVELFGEVIYGSDKLCARNRKVAWLAPALVAIRAYTEWASREIGQFDPYSSLIAMKFFESGLLCINKGGHYTAAACYFRSWAVNSRSSTNQLNVGHAAAFAAQLEKLNPNRSTT